MSSCMTNMFNYALDGGFCCPRQHGPWPWLRMVREAGVAVWSAGWCVCALSVCRCMPFPACRQLLCLSVCRRRCSHCALFRSCRGGCAVGVAIWRQGRWPGHAIALSAGNGMAVTHYYIGRCAVSSCSKLTDTIYLAVVLYIFATILCALSGRIPKSHRSRSPPRSLFGLWHASPK